MLFVDQKLGDAQVGVLSKKQLRAMVEPFLPRQEGALKARELAELLRQGVVVPVDVRDAGAYGRAHLPKAKSLPADEIETRLAEPARRRKSSSTAWPTQELRSRSSKAASSRGRPKACPSSAARPLERPPDTDHASAGDRGGGHHSSM